MSSMGKSNISVHDGSVNPRLNISEWIEGIPKNISSTKQDLVAGIPKSPSPRPSHHSSSHIFGKPLPNNASPAYCFAYAALYLNLPIVVICHELGRCGHRTTPDAVRHLLVEIDRDGCAEAPTSLFPPNPYIIRALVTFLLRRNVPVQAIWQNIMDWSGHQISGGVSRVVQKRNTLERMNRFLNHDHTPAERAAVKPGFEVAYIDNAYDLGFSAAQIVHYLTEAFPKASAWLTKEYVYGVLLQRGKFPQIMRTGRREWDRAGEEFARLASEAGLSDERVYCCLVMADYDIECDLELAEYFLARKERPPPPPAPEKMEEKDHEGTTRLANPLPRKVAPPPRLRTKKKTGEKRETYW